jgi:hypothetical protein
MEEDTGFKYFPWLPFELREMVWHYAASETHAINTRDVTWSTDGQSTNLELGRKLGDGKVITSREHGARPPAMGHTCGQARAVIMKHNELWRRDTRGTRVWDVTVDTVLITALQPRALLGKKHLTKMASGYPSIAISADSFTKPGSIPTYLFELMFAANRTCHFLTKIVMCEFTMRFTHEKAVETGLFGANAQETCQLVNVKNHDLLSEIVRLSPPAEQSWRAVSARFLGDSDDVRYLADQVYRERLFKAKIQPVEDSWLDSQLPVEGVADRGILSHGGGSRYRRGHEWVVETLTRMPRFEAVVMLRLELL